MTGHYPRLRHSSGDDDTSLSQREVIRLVLHLPLDHPDLSASVNRALDVYLSAIGQGPEILSEWCDVEGELDVFPLDDVGWDFTRSTLSPSQGERFLDDCKDEKYILRRVKKGFDCCVELFGGESGLSGYGFYYWSRLPWRTPVQDEVSLVSFSWPTEFLESHGPERMRELILELAALLPYASAHAGLAFFSPSHWGPSMRAIRDEAFRYPGLDVTHGQQNLGTRVDGVHWLNFLGPQVLESVGGFSALRARLHSPGTTVQPLDGSRAVVTLGSWPEAGDLSRGETLPAYHELAHVLEPVLYPCPPHEEWDGCAPEDPQRWWRRFLGPAAS